MVQTHHMLLQVDVKTPDLSFFQGIVHTSSISNLLNLKIRALVHHQWDKFDAFYRVWPHQIYLKVVVVFVVNHSCRIPNVVYREGYCEPILWSKFHRLIKIVTS